MFILLAVVIVNMRREKMHGGCKNGLGWIAAKIAVTGIDAEADIFLP